ncbi:uncharacterized protein LOC133910842 [Phragmites australis]|uniref:uncharacterized protein LOC133910842 n=1 Tax=Phragmites australis TaxID=29695 RepID=UPI002D76AE0C|nr:uncharacterized protein LOC133910842 [Phragmites australis]
MRSLDSLRTLDELPTLQMVAEGLSFTDTPRPKPNAVSVGGGSFDPPPAAHGVRLLLPRAPPRLADPVIAWYHANRMLSFYAPGWCGEVRDVIYTDNGKVTVVYRRGDCACIIHTAL